MATNKIEKAELGGFARAIEALAFQYESHMVSNDDSACAADFHACQDLLRVAHRLDDDLDFSLDDFAYDLFKKAAFRCVQQGGVFNKKIL